MPRLKPSVRGRARSVLLRIRDGIAVITINRPAVRNALDASSVETFKDALRRVSEHPDIAAVVITGAGNRAFSSGADIRALSKRDSADALCAAASGLYAMIERLPTPTIAAVNGDAFGGGCELALACDIRIAVEHARFAQPEVRLGVIPAAGGTQRLPRIIGMGRAKFMVLIGGVVDAQMALAWGLVSQVVKQDDLMLAAFSLVERIAANSPVAVRLAKMALDASARTPLDAGLTVETLAQAVCYEGEDKVEGTRAFLERRPPQFRRRRRER